MSSEICRVELELESPYAWIDLDLFAPGHFGQRARRGAGWARYQAMLSRAKASWMLPAGARNVNGGPRAHRDPRSDDDRPGGSVDESSHGHRLAPSGIRD